MSDEDNRQWLILRISLAVLVGLLVLSIIVTAENRVLAVWLGVGAVTLALWMIVLLVMLPAPPSTYTHSTWALVGVVSVATLAFWGWCLAWYATSYAQIRDDDKRRSDRERRTLTIGEATWCDYFMMTAAFIAYAVLVVVGNTQMSATTTTGGVQAVWFIMSLSVLMIFFGFVFHVTRYTLHVRWGSCSLCFCFGLLFVATVLIMVFISTALPIVISIEGMFAVLSGLVLLGSCSQCCRDCTRNRTNIPWKQQQPPLARR